MGRWVSSGVLRATQNYLARPQLITRNLGSSDRRRAAGQSGGGALRQNGQLGGTSVPPRYRLATYRLVPAGHCRATGNCLEGGASRRLRSFSGDASGGGAGHGAPQPRVGLLSLPTSGY